MNNARSTATTALLAGLLLWIVQPDTLSAQNAEPDDSAPSGDAGDSDAGDSDAGDSDAGDSDAGDSDAGDSDAGDSDASDSDAGDSDASDSDASDSDAGDSDAGDSDAGDSDASDSDAGDSDAGNSGAGDSDGSGAPSAASSDSAGEAGGADTGAVDADSGADEPDALDADLADGVATPEQAAQGGASLGAPDEEPAEADPVATAEEPASEEAAEEAEAESSPPEPLPWRNSFFTWTNQANFNSFLRDAQLSYNPVYQQQFTLSPRWYLGPMTQLRASVSLNVEITDTDLNALNRDPQLLDPVLTLLHMVPWEGFILMPQVRLAFPVSKASQASERYFQAGAGLTVVRIIPELANLTLAGVFSYRRWFAGSNVIRTGDPQPDRCGGPTPAVVGGADAAPQVTTAFCDQVGGASAASDVILAGISATMTPVGSFSINLSAFLFTLHGFGLAPWVSDPGQVITREEPLVLEDGSPSHWRNFTFVSVSVAYQFTPWLNMSLGIQNSGLAAPAYNPDGSLRNPLFTPDTQVFLSATFGVDTIYNELFGETEDDLTPEERQRRQQGLASGPSVGGAF